MKLLTDELALLLAEKLLQNDKDVKEELQKAIDNITTDVDNHPSIKTCERLGCVLESTVDVPGWCRAEFSISHRKRRYIYEIPEA